jgi:hypothetical protein
VTDKRNPAAAKNQIGIFKIGMRVLIFIPGNDPSCLSKNRRVIHSFSFLASKVTPANSGCRIRHPGPDPGPA